MPLSLLYIGGMLSMTDVRKVLRCGELYAEIGLKMLVLPLVYFLVMRLCHVPGDMAGTMTFLTGLPAINMVAMLCKNNGSDGDYAVCAVMMTTIGMPDHAAAGVSGHGAAGINEACWFHIDFCTLL